MRILGAALSFGSAGDRPAEHTLILLDAGGALARRQRLDTLPAVAATVGELAGDETFLLGANLPVVVPAKASRARTVENLARRRFGVRFPPGGRATLAAEPHGIAGEALIAGLAAAGLPCLPYPDRDGQNNGLVETHPALILKSLLWEAGNLHHAEDAAVRGELFRAHGAPPYRRADLPARSTWADQAVAIDRLLDLLGSTPDLDLSAVRDELSMARSATVVESAGSLLDALLIAYTVRRYVESPESCLFLGDRAAGYMVLPADGFIRRLGVSDARPRHGDLFPPTSLHDRLGDDAKIRSTDLLDVPGRPHRVDATFKRVPQYEFDNLDEMLWWKHCRHLSGPSLPTEGLCELVVEMTPAPSQDATPLRLVRSRHRTLSFRFDPPSAWRNHLATRDGKTYPIRILRAVYETLPPQA